MSDYYASYFIKKGETPYVEALFYEGEVFLGTLQSFTKLEDQSLKDETEAHLRIIPAYASIEIPKQEGVNDKILLRTTNKKGIRLSPPNVNLFNYKANAYCLYAITNSLCQQTDRIDPLFLPPVLSKDLSFVLILNPNEFIARVVNSLKNKGFDPDYRPVEYYDPITHTGEISPFHKRVSYKHESEYRFFCLNTEDEPITVNIGSIQDIAMLFPVEHLRHLRFSIKPSATSNSYQCTVTLPKIIPVIK